MLARFCGRVINVVVVARCVGFLLLILGLLGFSGFGFRGMLRLPFVEKKSLTGGYEDSGAVGCGEF